MLLFDTTNMDVDTELNDLVEDDRNSSDLSYLIMNKDTFKLFKKLSDDYDKKSNCWYYSGPEIATPSRFEIAIDKKLDFGEVVIK